MIRFAPRLSLTLFALGLAAQFGVPAGAATPAAPVAVDWNLSASQIATSCTAAIARAQTRVSALLAARGPRTFGTVVLPLEALTADLNDQTVAQTFLTNVSTDSAVRDTSQACNVQEGEFFTKICADPRLYKAVAAANQSKTARTVYDKKLTSLWLDSLKRSGAGLPPARRAEFVKLSNELTTLQSDYQRNLGEDQSTITITPAQAESLPSDIVAGLKHDASGGYIVPVNESTAVFLSNEKDPAARQRYAFAYSNRAAGKNVALLERAIAVRDRLAHLLGYQTWAAYQLSDRLAKTPAHVFSFLQNLDTALLPKARADVATLTALKAKDTGNPNATLDSWDFAYYDNMLNKTQYAVDNNAIRQYFPVQHTIDSVLNIYHTLLAVNFTKVAQRNVWNPDVLQYAVTDARTGVSLGTTYFDLYPRPGKYDHFANFPLVPVRRMPDGSLRPGISAIVGNWPKPAPGHPALLSHDDVVTFFHEFGHNMAALLATAPYETLSSGFVQDFVEAPSQMLENFVWQPSILKQISSNAVTGQPLPDALIASMIKARYVDDAYYTTGQIKYALIDMDYHTQGPHVDTTAVWANVSRETTPMALTPGTHPQAAFGHLMGGYDAGYYGYLFSKVYAQDMFTAFLQGGLENPAVGARYRTDILQPARTLDPDVEVAHFLGRPMSPTAFYQEFGISSPGSTAKHP
ncbi:MAG: Zn-dependent oligopeptidase [Candidatus Eremiobacteraeota bacterium]|nr:Zn-dependent oligopeptidase [Candidatus Eremiobacteraeota bacterium]